METCREEESGITCVQRRIGCVLVSGGGGGGVIVSGLRKERERKEGEERRGLRLHEVLEDSVRTTTYIDTHTYIYI